MAGRLTYLFVLAILAALVSVLNARTPGERVWAGLMFLLIVVFMIPWLEEAGGSAGRREWSLVHLDSPWTIFYGLLVVVGVTNYLPTRFGLAATCVGLALDPGVSRPDAGGLAARAASRRLGVGGVGIRGRDLGRSLERGRSSAVNRFDGLWFWFRDHWGVVWALAESGTVQSNSRAGGMAGPAHVVWPGACRRAR